MKRFLIILNLIIWTVVAVEAKAGTWSKEATTPGIDGRSHTIWSIESDNTVKFRFPYSQSNNRGIVAINQFQDNDVVIVIAVKSGQLVCQRYDVCYIRAKFDNGPVDVYMVEQDRNGRFNRVLMSGESARKFYNKTKTADAFKVEVYAYQDGEQVLDFSVSKK